MIAVFGILPGFYIAALAAVATFYREEIDKVMPHPAPTLKMRTGPRETDVKLTFRMFMSHLFSYLTAVSFLAVFVFVMAELVAASVLYTIGLIGNLSVRAWVLCFTESLYVATVAWLASKIVLTTLVGLYFLAERMHRPDA